MPGYGRLLCPSLGRPRQAHLRSRVGGLGFILDVHHAVAFGEQPTGRLLGEQSNDLGAFLLGYSRSAPGSGTISKPIYPFGVEAVEAPSETVSGWQPGSSAILAVRTPCASSKR